MASPEERHLMPDVRGMSLRRAINLLNAARIRPKVSGSGIVRTQSPPPGTPMAKSSRGAVLGCGGG
jgi:beta-lactam-binding protein with PASTA domain